jgi:hypothetical protein
MRWPDPSHSTSLRAGSSAALRMTLSSFKFLVLSFELEEPSAAPFEPLCCDSVIVIEGQIIKPSLHKQ